MEQHTFTERVAAELRAEMARQSRTTAQMSHDLGIPRSTLTRRLSGQRALDTDQLAAVTGYLGVSVEAVVHRAAEPPRTLEWAG